MLARLRSVPALVGKQELVDAARAKLLAVAKRKVRRTVPQTVSVRIGEPDREILAAAARFDVDVLVLHTEVKPGLEGLLHNGVTRRVIYGVPCPVLTIPSQVLWQSDQSLPLVRPGDWRNILVPMEMTRVGHEAFLRGLAVADWFNAKVTAFNVLRTGRLRSQYRPTRAGNRRMVEAKATFSAWVRRRAPGGVAVETYLGVGQAAPTFLQAARHLQAHLIVMGTQQFSGWRRFRAGCAVSRILAETPCPILSVPQPPIGSPTSAEA